MFSHGLCDVTGIEIIILNEYSLLEFKVDSLFEGGVEGIRDFILTRGILITSRCALERIEQKVYLWTYFLS